MLKIYLDNCVFNRPFDDQRQIRIKLETDLSPWQRTLWTDKSIEAISHMAMQHRLAKDSVQ